MSPSSIPKMMPFDGKCQNLQMTPTHFCASFHRQQDITIWYIWRRPTRGDMAAAETSTIYKLPTCGKSVLKYFDILRRLWKFNSKQKYKKYPFLCPRTRDGAKQNKTYADLARGLRTGDKYKVRGCTYRLGLFLIKCTSNTILVVSRLNDSAFSFAKCRIKIEYRFLVECQVCITGMSCCRYCWMYTCVWDGVVCLCVCVCVCVCSCVYLCMCDLALLWFNSCFCMCVCMFLYRCGCMCISLFED